MCKYDLHLTVSCLLILASTAPRAGGAEFLGLGFLSGDEISSANFVTADGSMVLGRSAPPLPDSNEGRSFRWTRATGMELLELPADFRFHPGPQRASADGSVLVGAHEVDTATSYPAYWSAETGIVNLSESVSADGVFPAVSPDGLVIAGNVPSLTSPEELFRWTDQTGLVTLGRPTGATFISVGDVSADRRVIVGGADAAGAFVWTEDTGFSLIAGEDSFATAVSDDGNVAAVMAVIRGRREAFRWTAGGGLSDLGSSPGHESVNALSGDGSTLVGTVFPTLDGTPLEAFIWDDRGGLRNLQNVLETDYGLDGELFGWHLRSAHSISHDGRTIVGQALNPLGQLEAYMAILDPRQDVLRGDYNASGVVEQADLDLVLLNWGEDVTTPPAGWTADLPSGIVDQAELDGVLLNWGARAAAAAVTAVPEPATAVLLALGLAILLTTTHARARLGR